MLSWPMLGPITLSDTITIGAASEPAFSNRASSAASLGLSRPLVWKFLPNTPRTVA